MTTQESILDSTISAFRNGITSMGIQRAIAVIDDWQTTIQTSGRAELVPMINDLGELRDMLMQGQMDSSQLGPLLNRLGSSTSEAVEQAPDDVKPKLEQLGQMLTKAAGQLSGRS